MGAILLVRHGQASWGAADYDVLSETGWEQSRALGRSLAARGVRPTVVLRGAMRRHRETAEGIVEGYAADGFPVAVEDGGWDEFAMSVFDHHPPPWGDGVPPGRQEFQVWFTEAMERWTGGAHDADYDEPFDVFGSRVEAALRRTAQAAGPGLALVVSSGGAISWTAAALLGRDLDHRARVALSQRMNPVCANSGITRVVSGRRGLSLVAFNEHAHLDGTDLLTYR